MYTKDNVDVVLFGHDHGYVAIQQKKKTGRGKFTRRPLPFCRNSYMCSVISLCPGTRKAAVPFSCGINPYSNETRKHVINEAL